MGEPAGYTAKRGRPLGGLSQPFCAPQYEDRRADWVTNEAGFSHSHQHGFGLLNAWRLVNAAKVRLRAGQGTRVPLSTFALTMVVVPSLQSWRYVVCTSP